MCKRVRISIRTGMFNPDEPKFAKGVVCELPYPTNDTRYIIRAAIAGLEHIYRDGFVQQGRGPAGPLPARRVHRRSIRPNPARRVERVMGVLDAINAKWGRIPSGPAA